MSHQENNLSIVMCRQQISIDWQGDLYDCDFNQMLKLHTQMHGIEKPHLRDLLAHKFVPSAIVTADHCYACTAGQGSSCTGSLKKETEINRLLEIL